MTDNTILKIEIIFLAVFSFLILLGSIGAVLQIIKPTDPEKRINYILGAPLGFIILFFMVRQTYSTYGLTYDYTFVTGTTIGDCDAGKYGRGIEFEYDYLGNKYTNCAIRQGDIKVKKVGGKYKVRVPKNLPQNGRIDFTEPITEK